MGVFIKKTGSIKTIKQLVAHSKYIGFRSREIEDNSKGFFGRDNNYEDYKKFIKRIQNNKAIKHPNSIKAHKLVFSLKGVDYGAYKRSGKNYKELIRKTLNEYEKKHGIKLDWIASIHDFKGHPHVHVIIKAVSDSKDKDGRNKRVFLKKNDFKEMKDIFNKEFEKDVKYRLYEKYNLKSVFKDISKGFEQVLKGTSYDLEKENRETEYKKKQQLKKRKQREREEERER